MTWFGFLELVSFKKTFDKRNGATSNTFNDACIGSSSKEVQKNKYQEDIDDNIQMWKIPYQSNANL